jgi:predicted DNA-binding protein with PD1-like motif
MLRLEDGDDLFPTLRDFAQRQRVRAASVVEGIGMLKDAEVGYWDGRQYAPQRLTTPHELIALHGSIAEADGAPSVHLHVALGGPDHHVVGGHLLQGTVGVLAEIFVVDFPGRVFGRPLDETFGLRRLDLEPGPGT